MSAEELLRDLKARGITAYLENGLPKFKPASLLTDADRAAIREHKAEVVRLLTAKPASEPYDAYAATGRKRPESSMYEVWRRVLRGMPDD